MIIKLIVSLILVAILLPIITWVIFSPIIWLIDRDLRKAKGKKMFDKRK